MAIFSRITFVAAIAYTTISTTYAIPTTSPTALDSPSSLGLSKSLLSPHDILRLSKLKSHTAGFPEFKPETDEAKEVNVSKRNRKDARLSRRQAFRTCKVIPSDALWPSQEKFDELERATEGSIIKTVPISAVCFSGASYDSEKCAEVTDRWSDSFLQ